MSTRAHLTNDQLRKIWTLHQKGLNGTKISGELGVSSPCVYGWIKKLSSVDGNVESLPKRTKYPRSYQSLNIQKIPKRNKDDIDDTTEDDSDVDDLRQVKLKQNRKRYSPINTELCKRMVKMYEDCGSVNAVAKKLEVDGICISPPTIRKRMREYLESIKPK